VLPLVIVAALGFGAKYGYDWYVTGRFIVSTDDAYVKADMSVVAAKVSGLVAAVPVVDNQHVVAGDVLVRIDDTDYRLAAASARNKLATQQATIARLAEQVNAQAPAIAQATAQLVANRADLARAEADYQRADSLARRDFGSKQQLDQARADRDRAQAAVTGGEAAIAAAKANLAVVKAQEGEAEHVLEELRTALTKAESDLAATVVRAPFAGIVGNRAAQPGQYIQPGTRLLALVPVERAYITANFKETQLADLKPGQKAHIAVDAMTGEGVEGTVESIAPASGSEFSLLPPENATGNFTKIVQRVPVRIAVPASFAASGKLRPGLSVVVEVDTRDPSKPAPTLMGALGFTR
jgi:membrane fusion protein (multidrug efflux system)